jgi:uncharacterized protein YidB (DUF937 family)
MGLFDSITSGFDQHPEVNPQQHATLVQSAMEMLRNHGGLSSLVSNAESNGLGGIVQSWIGTGANQSVNPQQASGIFGQDKIEQIAARAGIPPAIASAALARILPSIVDKLTPNGHLPQAA